MRLSPFQAAISALLLIPAVLPGADGGDFSLEKGDHISILGNTLAERMQHDGYLEAFLNARHPRHELSIRNLGFSGDELTLRLRSKDFGSPDEWLTRTEADVVFAFFGYNESFAGEAGVEKFKADLAAFIEHTRSQKYDGEGPPRLVLFSPIAHEDLGDRNLPAGDENNRRLAIYTGAMKEVAEQHEVPFVDLFAPTRAAYRQAEEPLTINGVHLNERGNRQVASIIDAALFGADNAPRPGEDSFEKVRAAVLEKNFYWFNRYRTTDGYSIFGGRADLKFTDGQTNRVVMQREMEVLDVMTANRDQGVWAAAEGKAIAIDDGNAPPFIPVVTNKPGPLEGGRHVFVDGEKAIDMMTAAKGMKVNLFASEEQFPELASPVQMAFDTKGRLWVAAWPSYPHWQPKEEMNDKLLIFEDTDQDGRADKVKVFADGLHNPTGFELWGGGVLVAMAPYLLFLQDTDGDDVADVRTRVLGGLDTADTHHTANSFLLDPGGALYFQEGTFHHTQVESPYGPTVRCANGGVYRYDPRSRRFEVYVSYGFANPHGHAFDRWGQDIVHDGTGAVPYHGTVFSGHVDFPRKHPKAPTVYQQRTRPCPATEVLSSGHFPDEMQGDLLVGNVIGFQGILRYKISDKGSSLAGEEQEPLLFSSDPSFRPVDLEIGPDGALYFVDWQNPIIGHMQHNIRDPSRDKTHGRVYRVTYEGRPLLDPPPIDAQPIAALLDLLKSPEGRVRYRTRIELSERDSGEVAAAVEKWIAALNESGAEYEHHLLEALWVQQHHHVVDRGLLLRVLRSPDFRARAAATRVLCNERQAFSDAIALLKVQAGDEHPRVRLEAVRACSFFPDAQAADAALESLKHPSDEYLDYVLTETMKTLEPYWKEAIAGGGSLAGDNPAGVNFLLSSVSTAELVKLPRTTMVYQALLSRPNVLAEYRHEALMGLAMERKTDMAAELLAAIERLDQSNSPDSQAVLFDLAHLMVGWASPGGHDHGDAHGEHDHGHGITKEDFAAHRADVERLAKAAKRPITRRVAYLTLMTADGSIEPVWSQAELSLETLRDVVNTVPILPDPALRAEAHPKVAPLLDGLPPKLAGQAAGLDGVAGRYVRIELPGRRRTLTLAEVEVFSDGRNVAPGGKASQSATSHGGDAARAIDGNKSGNYGDGGQTHTPEDRADPWWEVDLGGEFPVEAIAIYNRSENNGQFVGRLDGFTLTVLDDSRRPVYQKAGVPAPAESVRFDLEGNPAEAIRRAAINAVTYTGVDETETFKKLAGFVLEGNSRAAAVKALGRIPRRSWPAERVKPLVDDVIAHVSEIPADKRTAPAVLDELALAKSLTAALPKPEAEAARKALSEIGVNVIRLRPVPHKMIYDRSQIFVEAGKPVEIIFENVDIMPHNLVIVQPRSLAAVGIAAEEMATQPDAFQKQFIPNLPQVMHFTRLLQPGQTDRISFTAPAEVGEYPYVCTFPGHWRRMYGAMHVVDNLDDVPPEALAPAADPDIQTRPFVRAWKLEELEGDISLADGGRSFEQAESLFKAVSCVQCHKLNGQGGEVGPDLAGVKEKLAKKEMTRLDVLKEMVEPSAKIDENFQTWIIVDGQGRVHTGIITNQDDTSLRLVANPLDDKDPLTIPLTDIDEQLKSKISLMPQGLLNTLTKEEIFDLVAYIETAGDPASPAFSGE